MNESKERNVYKPCVHVTRYKHKKDALSSYEILHAYFVACIARSDAMELKKKMVRCRDEGCKRRSKIHACLSCKYFGCFKGHIQNHSRRKNHSLSVDTTFGGLFCNKCNDFQYDKDFEKISRKQFSSPVCPRGLIYNKWTPSIEQLNMLRQHDIIDITNIALRGFLNLGNICYVSCIFQALIHAPVFRNYFLSLKHKCDSRPGFTVFEDKILQNVPSCYVCEVSKIVLECFSGKLESVKPIDFMVLFWLLKTNSYDFKPYGMCDAFLFYSDLVETLLCALQDKSSEQNQVDKPNEQNGLCDIEVIFSGSHKNVFTCKECGNVSSTTHQFKSMHFNSKPKSDSNEVTFKDCLEENLHSVVLEYDCEKCGMKKTNDCEIIYERLPLICCFQLTISAAAFTDKVKKSNNKKENSSNNKKENSSNNEDENSSNNEEEENSSNNKEENSSNNKEENSSNNKDENSSNNKKENPETDKDKGLIVRFEEYFDMTPYKYSLEERKKRCGKLEPNPLNFFYLFAVVEYKGQGQKGHYVSYVRRNRSNWFKCDDEKIQPIKLEEVKKINPYLLFYQRPLDENSKLLLSKTEKRRKQEI